MELKYMDIHTHILPGIDDGAADMEEALEMADMAYEEGVRYIVATPHYGRMNPGYDPEKAAKTCAALRKEIAARHPDMKLFMGNELFYSPAVLEDLKNGKARTLGGSDYVLVEFHPAEKYENIEKAVHNVVAYGYRPIIAHVERYSELYKGVGDIEELIDAGAYIQVNARSLLGSRFDKRTRWCRTLVSEGLIHFIASDCHNAKGRSPVMQAAAQRLEEWAGEETVKQIMQRNIQRLVQNKYL